jgi:YD repeat-containing protein
LRNTGSSVSFGYTSGDMTVFTDPEGKIWTYHYNTDHRMDSLKDPDGRIIAENDYDSAGRVATQRSMVTPPRRGPMATPILSTPRPISLAA